MALPYGAFGRGCAVKPQAGVGAKPKENAPKDPLVRGLSFVGEDKLRMDSLQKCAKAFDQLTRYQYHFVIGRKGQTLKFTVSFDPSDFHHLAGLHKLKDNVRLQTGQRSTIFRDVLDGKYPFE